MAGREAIKLRKEAEVLRLKISRYAVSWGRCSTVPLPSYHPYRYLVITPTRLEEMLDNADRTMRDALLAATRME
eukprot:scaffold29895_cov32-Phaeocystis_antarctica.AAC.2